VELYSVLQRPGGRFLNSAVVPQWAAALNVERATDADGWLTALVGVTRRKDDRSVFISECFHIGFFLAAQPDGFTKDNIGL
jgi:hypothetical protein